MYGSDMVHARHQALFRWQAFVYLVVPHRAMHSLGDLRYSHRACCYQVLTVCYTFFCLTCATSDKSFIDQMEDK